MIGGRQPFAYVVAIDGAKVILNLLDAHRGQVATHADGITPVTEVGGLFAVDGGAKLLVLRVRSLSFSEPREAHSKGIGSTASRGEPLRHLEATVIGTITRRSGAREFRADSLASPALGAEAYPLSYEESSCILKKEAFATPEDGPDPEVCLGIDPRSGGRLMAGLTSLLGRHVAVLGSTGSGKSCLTAAVIQQVLHLPGPRVVVFDINGEYLPALEPHVAPDRIKRTVLGGPNANEKIPFYALGRHGLSRLLLPSEKTQRPALTFALENLGRIEWHAAQKGASLAGGAAPSLFDDCRPGDATQAGRAIEQLRAGTAPFATRWPHMSALACLIAESHSVKQARQQQGAFERDAFLYGNVGPLVTRVRRCVEDSLFTSVVDVEGGEPCRPGQLDWAAEGEALCNRIFGEQEASWILHVVDLRNVAHDLMLLVLGSLLELLAFELFRRGQDQSYPTLLVLEEAHHYLRQMADSGEEGGKSALAYERLAKEGRKFGLGLWISTQRPSEVSPTVLS